MIERIKGFDFLNSTEEEVNNLITDMVALPTDDLKNCVNEIVDTIDYKYTSDDATDKLPNSYEMIFNNEEVKKALESLLEEYNEKI